MEGVNRDAAHLALFTLQFAEERANRLLRSGTPLANMELGSARLSYSSSRRSKKKKRTLPEPPTRDFTAKHFFIIARE